MAITTPLFNVSLHEIYGNAKLAPLKVAKGEKEFWVCQGGVVTTGSIIVYPSALKVAGSTQLMKRSRPGPSASQDIIFNVTENLGRMAEIQVNLNDVWRHQVVVGTVPKNGGTSELLMKLRYDLYWVRWLLKHSANSNRLRAFVRFPCNMIYSDIDAHYMNMLEIRNNKDNPVAFLVPQKPFTTIGEKQ